MRRGSARRVQRRAFRLQTEIHEHRAGEAMEMRVPQPEELHAGLFAEVAAMVALSRKEAGS